MVVSATAHYVPECDIGLLCHGKMLSYYQVSLLSHGLLLIAKATINDTDITSDTSFITMVILSNIWPYIPCNRLMFIPMVEDPSIKL
jgi:hypothetical protein